MYFENFNPTDVVTPIKIKKFINGLRNAKYDAQETDFLEQSLINGFSIGYEGPQTRKSTAENIPFSMGDETILWNKLIKEVKAKRVAGPFREIPFDNFIQSPIGLVPKDNDQTRLIFHLSYDGHKRTESLT